MKLKNQSNNNIYLLKTWTSFESIQRSNPKTVYFDLTFPIGGDIYSCKSCTFKLHKIKPLDTIKLEVVKINYRDVSEILIMFDQIKASKIENKKTRKSLLKSDQKGQPELKFKYYYESGGTPINGETIRLKM